MKYGTEVRIQWIRRLRNLKLCQNGDIKKVIKPVETYSQDGNGDCKNSVVERAVKNAICGDERAEILPGSFWRHQGQLVVKLKGKREANGSERFKET